jgi:hypothetical protein
MRYSIFNTIYRIRKKRRRQQAEEHHCQSQFSRTPQNAYDASIRVHANSQEHIYSEIKTSENIYNEIDALITETNNTESPPDEPNDTNDATKVPVTMKRSYSSPKDLQHMIEGQENQELKDPNYVYPYDKVQRSDTDIVSSNETDEKTCEVGENEITDEHNKHTVV